MVEFSSIGVSGDDDDGGGVGPAVGASKASLISCPSRLNRAEFPSPDDVGDSVGTTASLMSLRRVVIRDIVVAVKQSTLN